MTAADTPSFDVETLLGQWLPGCQVSILKEIVGGKSGAAVLLVDINSNALGETGNGLQAGQYILKVQAPNTWSGEAQESTRHADAASKNAAFSIAHIPVLCRSDIIDGQLLLLYDVAGQSLSSFVSADTIDAVAVHKYCALAASDLWLNWNDKYTLNSATSAQATLKKWLGYRLEPTSGISLHTLVETEYGKDWIFRIANRVLVNPLVAATSEEINVAIAGISIDGMIHGDMHLGNILVDRTLRSSDRYWIIDFALARNAPLGFDQSYLELSLLLSLLQGVEPQRILNILDALESADDPTSASRLPVSDVGLLNACQEIRRPNRLWQESREPRRSDSVTAQTLLARIAVGLNWANKPIADAKRKLALAYAAWAATHYLELFNPLALSRLQGIEAQTDKPPRPLQMPTWSEVWEQLSRFDDTKARYVLVAGRLVASPELQSLAMIPWSAIVDLDPISNEEGLHLAISGSLGARRSINQFGLVPIPIDADRGTSWFMAYGWPSRYEPIPQDFRRWRSEYGERFRSLFRELRRATSPLPVKVVFLATPEIDERMLQSLVAMADESLEAASDITVIGRLSVISDPAIKAQYPSPVPAFVEALHHVFGAPIETEAPEVPGVQGPTSIPLNQLRSLEEDFDVLHSNVLNQVYPVDGRMDAFWKGNPPSWADLHAHVDVRRDIAPRLHKKVSNLLHRRGNFTLELQHTPGAGGTTAALRCGWNLKSEFPVVVLRRYSTTTAERVDQIFRLTDKPVLVIADAAILPPASREDLYRDIAKRNVRCVILYVHRTFDLSPVDEAADESRLVISDPMPDREAIEFQRAFSARTGNPKRHRLLAELATADNWKSYRSPFFFGLTTYEEEFESVQSYVEYHLTAAASTLVKNVVALLALVTRYSQTGISVALVKQLLGLSPASDVEIQEALGEVLSRLIVQRGNLVRLLHPVIAEEVLQQSMGGKDWKHGLKDQCLAIIAKTSEFLGSDSAETLHLFSELFIRRDYWTPSAGRRRNFSELILEIPTNAGQHQILLALTAACPQESHFWNHLGRHHIYEMKQDFEEAERYLQNAIALDDDEQVHHHSLGMVRRFWVRSLLAEMMRRDSPPTPEEVFEAIEQLVQGAAEEFAHARQLGPEDDHGYITHVQLIVETLETLVRLDRSKALSGLILRPGKVGEWARTAVVVAEDLLSQVRHLRERAPPSRYELRCTNELATLYGHFDAVIGSLEDLLKSVESADVRRALAVAYYSRSGRVWSNLSATELRRTKELMEYNLRADPTNGRDIRMWFQVTRRLPEFSYIESIDRLESWAKASDHVDAHYYLYILHFLRWWQGSERDEVAMRESLEKCRIRAIGRRGLSYEWLSMEPNWCPLAHASELGVWHDYWEKSERLNWISGSIASIKPQAGTIRLGAQTIAYFVPGTKFSETRHLNTLVKCQIGFSYEGLRAWSVELGEEGDQARNRSNAGHATRHANDQVSVLVEDSSPPAPNSRSYSDLEALARNAERHIQDLLSAAISRNKPLYVAAIGNKLVEKLGKPPVYSRLGFRDLSEYLMSIPTINIVDGGNAATVTRSDLTDSSGKPPAVQQLSVKRVRPPRRR